MVIDERAAYFCKLTQHVSVGLEPVAQHPCLEPGDRLNQQTRQCQPQANQPTRWLNSMKGKKPDRNTGSQSSPRNQSVKIEAQSQHNG